MVPFSSLGVVFH